MNSADGSAIIGKSVKITGDVSGSEDLVVDGELEGSIHLPGARLTIGPAGRVRATIIAEDVVIFGRLDGEVRANGRCELRATALVHGKIFAPRLSIEENAAFRGQVDPTPAQGTVTFAGASAARPRVASRQVNGNDPAGSARLFAEPNA